MCHGWANHVSASESHAGTPLCLRRTQPCPPPSDRHTTPCTERSSGSPGDHDVRHCPSVDPLVPQNTGQTLPSLSPPVASNSPWVELMAPDHASLILWVKLVLMRSPWATYWNLLTKPT